MCIYSHEHARPDDAVKPNDVFADKMDTARPEVDFISVGVSASRKVVLYVYVCMYMCMYGMYTSTKYTRPEVHFIFIVLSASRNVAL